MAPTTTCDGCEGIVDLTLDQVLSLRVLIYARCPSCGERIVRLRPVEDIRRGRAA